MREGIRQAIGGGSGRPRLRAALVVAGIVLIAANLRPAITVVGPLVEQIRDDTGLSAAAAGLITTLPVLAFGVVGIASALLSRRFGLESMLLGSMLVLAAGVGLRAAPGLAPLFAGTLVVGVGIAVANVLLPALVKQDFPHRLGVMTALYSGLLGAFGAIGSGIAVPLADATALGWRGALAVWALPALVAAIVWAPQLARAGERRAVEPPLASPGETWRSPLAWAVTAFFGFQSCGFYVTIAWLPTILIEAGLSEARAGLMLFVLLVAALVAMLTVPQLADRAGDQRRLTAATAACLIAGATGVAVAGSIGVELWMVLLGLGQGAGLALALMFFVLRARDSHQASELSGMAQGVGYTFAATGPVLTGLVHDLTDAWFPVLVIIGAVGVALLATGARAGEARVIGEPRPGRRDEHRC